MLRAWRARIKLTCRRVVGKCSLTAVVIIVPSLLDYGAGYEHVYFGQALPL